MVCAAQELLHERRFICLYTALRDFLVPVSMPLVQTGFDAEGERTLGFLDGEVRDVHVVKLRAWGTTIPQTGKGLPKLLMLRSPFEFLGLFLTLIY